MLITQDSGDQRGSQRGRGTGFGRYRWFIFQGWLIRLRHSWPSTRNNNYHHKTTGLEGSIRKRPLQPAISLSIISSAIQSSDAAP